MAKTDAPAPATTGAAVAGAPPGREGADNVILGHIVGVFGLRGELRVFLHNRDSDLLHTPRRVMLHQANKPPRPAVLQIRPGAGRRIIGRIDGIRTPEAAETLVGAEIFFPKAALPALEDDTYYHHQLLNLPVRTVSGLPLGRLAEIMDTADVDIWVVQQRDGETRYIPATEEQIVSVTVGSEGEIVVID